jgi:hypothetical protein
MRRWIAVLWHASFFVIAAALYFFFVLPRWYELTDAWPVGLGLAMRILAGALIGLAALPVVFTLLRSRRPEFGTPKLALTLRYWSIVLHVLAGALIVGAAVSEIWVTLDAAGPILFAIYGAAAAVAILGAVAFYLAYAAELPPPPPKPLRPRGQTRRRGRGSKDDSKKDDSSEDDADAPTDEAIEASEAVDETAPADVDTDQDAVEDDAAEGVPAPALDEDSSAVAAEPTAEPTVEPTDAVETNGSGNAERPADDESGDKLRNRRPQGSSTSRLFGRSRR